MFFLENLKIAIESIRSNKMRSFLTMLGIIIGISSVITIVSLGEGGKATITGEFEKIGAATVTISVRTQEAGSSDYITNEDIKKIKEVVPTVKYISPVVQKTGYATNLKKSKRSVISGVNADYAYIQNSEFLYGRMFSEREYEEGKAVIIIEQGGARALFGYEDVVGEAINIGTKSAPKKATIIGVVKSSFSMFGIDENMPAMIYTPASYLNILYPNDFNIESLTIMATSKDSGEEAGNGALNVLKSRHNNRDRQVYRADNPLKQLEQINQVLGIFTAFIGAVAAISLLVGGIGVMNIMLVSVTERTREIGIRKAIGATTNTILLQFLTESVIISTIGGIVGLIAGLLGAYAIGSFAEITPVLSVQAITGAILFSMAVGIFFGIYPARKAARLDPIDALRYE